MLLRFSLSLPVVCDGSVATAVARLCGLLGLVGLCMFSAPLRVLSANSDLDSGSDQPTLLVAVGAPGESDFGDAFMEWEERLKETATRAGAKGIFIGPSKDGSISARERVRQALAEEDKVGTADLWILLIGHGTFDNKEAKFNLVGPDLSAADLVEWLGEFRRPVAVVVAASASSPFLNALSATNRVVVTATRSGAEVSYSRFGGYFVEAIGGVEADLDKDGQTSLLEAFLMAAHGVNEFYNSEGRLASEHALLDDTGDRRGTPAHWFRGIRATKKARDGAKLDGTHAHRFHLIRSEAERRMTPEMRMRRDELETAITALREEKPELKVTDYYQKLEVLMLELARLYEEGSGNTSQE